MCLVTYILLILGLGEDYKSSHILNDVLAARNDPVVTMMLAYNPGTIADATHTVESRLLHA